MTDLSPEVPLSPERRLLAEHVTEGTAFVHRGRPWPPHLGRLYRPMTAEERTRADAAIARITGELRDAHEDGDDL